MENPSFNHDAKEPAHHHETMWFPKGFLWGAATSSHQVEGNTNNNDWWAWAKSGKAPAPGTGPDHYHRYREDFSIAQSLHQNAHRLSIEWSRIEPREGEFDEEEIEHYRQVIAALRERGLEPFVTLHHFTNPQWFAELGGWESRRAVRLFSRYVRHVAEALGEDVTYWITINEPMVFAVQGYFFGAWPPQKRSWKTMMAVIFRLARAHRKAYRIIHSVSRRKRHAVHVGIAHNVFSFHAYRKHSLFDQFAVVLFDRLVNHLFYYLSGIRSHDFLGLNYYFHYRIQRVRWRSIFRLHLFADVRHEKREMSDIGWEVYPHGIFEILLDLNDYKKPIYVTENGIATNNDDRRVRFLVAHAKEIYHAIQAGANVRGYFHWSLIDNYEWERGYAARFGLVEYDARTLERHAKPSAKVFAEIARINGITHDMLRFLGHGEKV